MDGKKFAKAVLLLVSTVGTCWGCVKDAQRQCKKEMQPDPVEKVLQQLKQETEQLESYQAQVEYVFKQPLFESQSLRKGTLYYQKAGKKSKLRVNFQTLKQDDEEEQAYIQQLIFDGVWLIQIDYQIKQVRKKQLAEPNEPVDAFELAKRNFPIIGFTKVQKLRKEFEIELVETADQNQPPAQIQLNLKVKADSMYKDDYTSIAFWIDAKTTLPAKIVAETTEEDIYEISFLKAKVNKKMDTKVFDYEIPEDFTVEEIPLEKTEKEDVK
ncbi:MAG: LolA family protein [Planctomycetota bacterium]|jgi:outer membrane lipoprotein-sorting protein